MRTLFATLTFCFIASVGSSAAAQTASTSRSEWEAAILHGRSPDSMLTFANRRAFLAARLARLDTLARDLRRYDRIHAMSDGLRHYVELNGATVTADTARLNPNSPGYERWVQPLAAILARDSIASATYEAFRQRLAATGFVEVAASSTYTAFLFDGFVAHGNGFVHVEPGAPAPTVGIELFNRDVRQIEEVGPGWFYFEI